ncbi:hypothetical protein ACJDU8_23245 [Clostridium sp. WILCCON 0269]|uniref:Zinc ribbon domain-containing protein n=1 Tax=Candidatus Clostridium eludens TaxID=3381663 RepID=A0ABW8SQU6_9CLOT
MLENKNMTKCKACNADIAKGVSKCPHCGKDQRNWFMKHKVLSVIIILIVIGAIGAVNSGGNSSNTKSTASNSTTTQSNTSSQKKEQPAYKAGDVIKTYKFEITITSAAPFARDKFWEMTN